MRDGRLSVFPEFSSKVHSPKHLFIQPNYVVVFSVFVML